MNRKRYAELEAEGRLKPAGLERPPTNRTYGPRPLRVPMPSRIPAYIEATLKKNATALRHFETMASWQRRRYLDWAESGKRGGSDQAPSGCPLSAPRDPPCQLLVCAAPVCYRSDWRLHAVVAELVDALA